MKKIFLILIVVSLLILGKVFHVQDLIKRSLDWVRDFGPAGALLFAGIYILACVLSFPGSILTLGAGAIYGVAKGSALVSVSSTLGAAAAFLAGRYFARGWVEKKIAGNEKFKAIDQAVAREGWKIVGLTRLSPVFPFNLLNYAYGVTSVSFRDFAFASWIGMMPGTVMYVYLGSLAGDAAELGSGLNGPAQKAQWAIRILGFAATVAVTVFVTKTAKKALDKRVPA